MRKFQNSIFIARPEGKDGIEKPKVEIVGCRQQKNRGKEMEETGYRWG